MRVSCDCTLANADNVTLCALYFPYKRLIKNLMYVVTLCAPRWVYVAE